MTNYERYKNEIDKIVRMGRMVAVEEKTGRVTSCNQITCFECKFDSCSSVDCDTAALAWADEEYIDSKEVDWSKVPVDTKIWVRNTEYDKWEPKYFAKYEDGVVYAWVGGATSFSAKCKDRMPWKYVELANE